MLQDLQAGRRMEIEALLGAVVELADLPGGTGASPQNHIYAAVSLVAKKPVATVSQQLSNEISTMPPFPPSTS